MSQDKTVTPLKETEELRFDGERFIPGAGVEITYHHWLRYFFARQLAQEKRVLDIASGEGYGAGYLAGFAKSVDAFDVNAEAVAHARSVYGDNPRLSFTRADIESFFKDAKPESYDLVTAFEVIEHVDERQQLALLEGIRRVLAPGGVALISTPDKQLYSDAKLMKNPFHVREMYREEFSELLSRVFSHLRIYEQLSYTGSAVTEAGATRGELCEMGWTDLLRLKGRVQPGVRGGGEYLIALVSNEPLEPAAPSVVMLDRSRKLVAEEVYTRQVELDERRRTESEARAEVSHLRDVIADLEKQNAEIKKVWLDPDKAAMLHATIDGLLGVVARNAVEMTEAQRNSAELDRLRDQLNDYRQQLAGLRSLVSVQLIGKAKRAWDRVPFVKNVVKAVVKKVI
jgi:2-polyprenyl-3-methyl-5-hydroxy-6-metoxy-1,4-benzoquinol methylase